MAGLGATVCRMASCWAFVFCPLLSDAGQVEDVAADHATDHHICTGRDGRWNSGRVLPGHLICDGMPRSIDQERDFFFPDRRSCLAAPQGQVDGSDPVLWEDEMRRRRDETTTGVLGRSGRLDDARSICHALQRRRVYRACMRRCVQPFGRWQRPKEEKKMTEKRKKKKRQRKKKRKANKQTTPLSAAHIGSVCRDDPLHLLFSFIFAPLGLFTASSKAARGVWRRSADSPRPPTQGILPAGCRRETGGEEKRKKKKKTNLRIPSTNARQIDRSQQSAPPIAIPCANPRRDEMSDRYASEDCFHLQTPPRGRFTTGPHTTNLNAKKVCEKVRER
ncbi:hypothetical protein VTN02DRAFT_912 [Thermoascus thermophilus]